MQIKLSRLLVPFVAIVFAITAGVTPTLAEDKAKKKAPTLVLITNVDVWDGTSDKVQKGALWLIRHTIKASWN